MAQILPTILMRYGNVNQPIRVPISTLLVDPPAQTLLLSDSASNSSTISVANITNLASGQILLIGDAGNQNSEIVIISGAPSGNTVTLSANTVYAHTANTPVTVLYFNQVQYFNALTASGVKTQLGSNTAIAADQVTTDYNDNAGSTGFYFARFRNSAASTTSVYSAPVPVDGYGIMSARAVIDAALNMINKNTSPVLTDEYSFQMIDACQMEVLREFKRWSWMQSFDTIIGTTAQGTWKIAVPANLDDQVTYKSIWNFRIGREYDMVWVAKDEFDALIQGVAYSTVAADTLAGSSTLVLVSTKDFTHDSGSIQVGANVYTFTANDTTTNTLTLGSVLTANVSANQDVFQFSSLGYPTYWTIYQGYIYHWPITSSVYANRNYWMDYYKKLIPTTTDYQELVVPDPTVVQYYLAWKFLLRINNGEETTASLAMKQNYQERLLRLKQKESVNRNFIFSPDLNGPTYY